MITPADRIELLKLLPKNAVVAEIGVLAGDYADQIRVITKPKELHLIDCWEKQDVRVYKDYVEDSAEVMEKNRLDVIKKFTPYSEVKILHSYSVTAAQNFTDEYFDWVYLDSNHSYETVKQDLQVWWPKIKSGGLFLGHDWVTPNSFVPFFGVIRAVTEFMNASKLSLEFKTREGWPSWGIRRP